MNATWGEILFEMRDQLNEPTPAFYTDDGLMAYYNRAASQFARNSHILEDTVTIAINPDGQTVNLPTTVLGILAVSIVNSEGEQNFIFPASERSQSEDSLLKRQQKYFRAGSLLTLTNQVTTDQSIRVKHFKSNIDFADSSDLSAEGQIPNDWVDIPIQGALWKAFRKRRDIEDSRSSQAQFLAGMKEARLFTRSSSKGQRQLNIVE